MKYFKIICWQGHFGAGQHQQKTLYICAKNLIAACDMAKGFPSICHNKPVISATEITKEEYDIGLANNLSNPFVNDRKKGIKDEYKPINRFYK